MSIGVKGQWYIKLDIDGITLSKPEILSILVIEQVGNLLPTIQLDLAIRNEKITESVLTQTAKIDLMLGKNKEDAQNYSFIITDVKPYPSHQSIGEYLVTIYGTESIFTKYLYNSAIKVYDMTSMEAIVKVLEEVDFGINTGLPPTSSDKMKWLQSGNTYKEFIDELLFHSYGGDKVTYFSSWWLGGFFIIEDIVDVMNNNGSFATFSEIGATDFKKGTITYFSPIFRTNFGLMNSWLGSGRKQSESNMLDNITKEIKSSPNKGKTNNDTTYDIDKKLACRVYNPENMHENYNKAKINNLTNLAFYSSSTAQCTVKDICSIGNSISGYRPNNKATILVGKTDGKNGVDNQSNDLYSGDYLVSKVARFYEYESYSETFHFYRPGVSQGGQ